MKTDQKCAKCRADRGSKFVKFGIKFGRFDIKFVKFDSNLTNLIQIWQICSPKTSFNLAFLVRIPCLTTKHKDYKRIADRHAAISCAGVRFCGMGGVRVFSIFFRTPPRGGKCCAFLDQKVFSLEQKWFLGKLFCGWLVSGFLVRDEFARQSRIGEMGSVSCTMLVCFFVYPPRKKERFGFFGMGGIQTKKGTQIKKDFLKIFWEGYTNSIGRKVSKKTVGRPWWKEIPPEFHNKKHAKGILSPKLIFMSDRNRYFGGGVR